MSARLFLVLALTFVAAGGGEPLDDVTEEAAAITDDNETSVEKQYAVIIKSLEKQDDVAPFVGLDLAPSKQLLRDLKQRAADAKKHRSDADTTVEEVPPNCAECAKQRSGKHAREQPPKARQMEKEAKVRFREATKWAALEMKRERALPRLARAMRQQAQLEHQLLIAEEKRANETRKSSNEQKGGSLTPLLQGVAKQRFVDRLRAAEDERVAALAVQMAHQAHRKLKLKKQASNVTAPAAPTVAPAASK